MKNSPKKSRGMKMPKKLYICEVCGKRNDKTQVVCIKCVERDLLVFNERFKKIERRLEEFQQKIKGDEELTQKLGDKKVVEE